MSEQRQTDAPPEWWDEFQAAANGAAGRAGGGPGGPGGGPTGYPPRGFPDLTPLIALVDAMRRVVPLELQEQMTALQRELLLTIRALIDWYLERLDSQPRPTVVEDIPID